MFISRRAGRATSIWRCSRKSIVEFPCRWSSTAGQESRPSRCERRSRSGVAKVNFGTYLKHRYLKAMRQALGSDSLDPHRLLGMGGPEDVLVAGRLAVRDAVLERIELLGCCGKAETRGEA